MKINIIYQNKDFLLIDKSNNLNVQKNKKYPNSLEKILEDSFSLSFLPRCGIVHRLDRQTTGILMVAKNLLALSYFSSLFKERKIKKNYLALLQGNIAVSSGEIKFYIQKDFSKKKIKIKINKQKGKLVSIFFKVIERLENFTFVEIYPITGRTHQIRVAFKTIGYPLYNDPLYNNMKCEDKEIGQYLHAYSLEFLDNKGMKKKMFSPLPDFFVKKLQLLGSKQQKNFSVNNDPWNAWFSQ